MEKTKLISKETGMNQEEVAVTEVIDIPEIELQCLAKGKDSDNYAFEDFITSGYSHGYERDLVAIRKKGTEDFYRFMVIAYSGYQTFTKASRVFPVTKTYTKTSYTTALDE